MSIFSQIPKPFVKRSKFNMTHDVKTTIGMGKLVPYFMEEVIPGDKWHVQSDFLCRFAPMLAPVMHSISVKTEFFFVPTRLLWENFEDFITGGRDGLQSPVKPYVDLTVQSISDDISKGSLWDYYGLPVDMQAPENLPIDLLPFAAYQKIYQDYYIDQNVDYDNNIDFPLSDGSQSSDVLTKLLALRDRCWEKDYFTGCLPFVQRGPDVSIGLAGQADIVLRDSTRTSGTSTRVLSQGSPTPPALPAGALQVEANSAGSSILSDSAGRGVILDNSNDLQADLSTASAFDINDIRRSSAIQRFFEAMARGGSRYVEQMLAVFGVKSRDSRLQRAEFLGSGSSPCIFSEIFQTSETADTPQANMAGAGIAGGVSHGCTRYFTEHGFIIGMVSIRPRSNYILGVERKFRRFDKFDYAWPQLANLGEQPVYSTELHVTSDTEPDKVFGYNPRYSEYKYINSKTTGEFRDTLDYWHLTRKFDNDPLLSPEFMHIDQGQTTRIFASGDESQNQQIYLNIRNKVIASRPLPKYGVPILS